MRADADPAREALARAARARLRERLMAEAAELADDADGAVATEVRAFLAQLAAPAPDTAGRASGQ